MKKLIITLSLIALMSQVYSRVAVEETGDFYATNHEIAQTHPSSTHTRLWTTTEDEPTIEEEEKEALKLVEEYEIRLKNTPNSK